MIYTAGKIVRELSYSGCLRYLGLLSVFLVLLNGSSLKMTAIASLSASHVVPRVLIKGLLHLEELPVSVRLGLPLTGYGKSYLEATQSWSFYQTHL